MVIIRVLQTGTHEVQPKHLDPKMCRFWNFGTVVKMTKLLADFCVALHSLG